MVAHAPTLITAKQLAEMIHTSAAALIQQRQRDQAPGNLGFLVGKRLLFDLNDINAWIEETKRDG